jgi:nucleoside-diphosphate-sugar epimerase
VDVRDVAVAHVLAIDVPRAPRDSLESKRFLINGGNITWKEVADHLRVAHAGKVNPPSPDSFSDLPGPAGTLDTSRSKNILGLTYIDTRKTFEDAVDSLLEAERAAV